MKPAIGISATVERVRYGAWNEEVTMAPRSYSRAVQAAGGLAMLLPPDADSESTALVLERIDALILIGGPDVNPSLYGAEPDPETKAGDEACDRSEAALALGALERTIPVLGICRGMQVLNVALGGTLIQHLPDLLGHSDHKHTPGTFGDHEVRLDRGSLAAMAAGGERLMVKSHHHQGVERLGDGLVATGWSLGDEVIEAIELPRSEERFALGVLWHPEEDVKSRVISAIVGASRRQKVSL